MTPTEVSDGAVNRAPAFELRLRWPGDDEAVRVNRVRLVVKFMEGRRHLPIVKLKQAA